MNEKSSSSDNNTEYESQTLQLMRISMQQLFKTVANSVGLERFEELYKDALKGTRVSTKKLHNILIESVLNGMKEEFESFISDYNVNEKFKELEKIRCDTKMGQDVIAWRPGSSSFAHDLRSHDVVVNLEKKKQLAEFVEKEEAELLTLQQEILLKRNKVKDFQNRMLKMTPVLRSEMQSLSHLNSEQEELFCDLIHS